MKELLLSLLLLLAGGALPAPSAGEDCPAGQIRPLDPKTKGKDLPFNKYSWLTTHNSFAVTGQKSDTGTTLLAPTNQLDNVTAQLNNGVRGLMLDMYDFQNDIWLCHSFGGNCYNFTAFHPAINTLKEIEAFLRANPSEVITIFIEDYVKSKNGLSKVFNTSGLTKYWFPVSQMPSNGGNWPLLSDMISKNQRLLVFTSKKGKQASEGIAYEWNFVVENQYGDGGMKAGSCPNRDESSAMNTKTKSLVLMNYFPDNPNVTAACKDNSAGVASMLKTCESAAGDRWPNYIAIDFYTKGNGGEATDVANGHMVCGCDNLTYCKANATFGTCDAPPPAPAPAPAQKAPRAAAVPKVTPPSSIPAAAATTVASETQWRLLIVTASMALVLLT